MDCKYAVEVTDKGKTTTWCDKFKGSCCDIHRCQYKEENEPPTREAVDIDDWMD